MERKQLFPTSGRVDESRQIGRLAAIERLQARVERGQHALLFGERRIGKSSVSAAVVARIQAAGGIGIDVDLSAGITDERGLVANLLTQAREQRIGRATRGVARTRTVRRRVDRIRSAVGVMEALGIDESAELDHVLSAVTMDEGSIDLRRILAAIHADAVICGRPVVILVDEVQHLLSWGSTMAVQEELARTMRSAGGPSFVFAGSERRPIERLFAPDGPLHREGLIFALPDVLARARAEAVRHPSWGDR